MMWHYESVTSFFFSSNYFSLFLILRTLCDSGHVARFGRHIPTSISKLHRARSSQWDNVCLQPCQWGSKLCRFQSSNQNRKTTMEIRWVYIYILAWPFLKQCYITCHGWMCEMKVHNLVFSLGETSFSNWLAYLALFDFFYPLSLKLRFNPNMRVTHYFYFFQNKP